MNEKTFQGFPDEPWGPVLEQDQEEETEEENRPRRRRARLTKKFEVMQQECHEYVMAGKPLPKGHSRWLYNEFENARSATDATAQAHNYTRHLLEQAQATMQQREQMETDAAERIAEMIARHGVRTESLQSAMNSLYADWHNRFDEQQAAGYAAKLKELGVEVLIAHYTGDSSYPTEYTLSHGETRGMGPTFDLALVEFITELLKKA